MPWILVGGAAVHRETTCTSEHLLGRSSLGDRLIQPEGQRPAAHLFVKNNAVKGIGCRHGAAILGDHNELRVSRKLTEHTDVAIDISLIECSVNLIQDAERRGRCGDEGKEKCAGNQSPLAARECVDVPRPLARKLRDDLDRFLLVGTVEQELGISTVEDLAEESTEEVVDAEECHPEAPPHFPVRLT